MPIRRFRCCSSIPVGCFPETLAHRDALVTKLRLTDVRSITPAPNKLWQRDPYADIWSTNPDACCALHKVEPLADALVPYLTRTD
jgi:phosphoadenosine phosphosulfate reductase